MYLQCNCYVVSSYSQFHTRPMVLYNKSIFKPQSNGAYLQSVGFEINVTRYLIGHIEIKTTSKYYIDIIGEVLNDVRNKVNMHTTKRRAQ